MDAATLAQVMDHQLSDSRYAQLVDECNTALLESDCTTVVRAAMFLAQIGEESLSLFYTEEQASGSEYEWRGDLGNSQSGDGVRYKGRSFIQVTGRSNYGQLSQWAHGKGYIPTNTYFVDHPEKLADDQYAFLGPVWYWTDARPQMNSLADSRDIYAATRAVNGGLNGIDDRVRRWNNCLGLGDRILPEEQVDYNQLRSIVREENKASEYRVFLTMRGTLSNLFGVLMTGKPYAFWTKKRVPNIADGEGLVGHRNSQRAILDDIQRRITALEKK